MQRYSSRSVVGRVGTPVRPRITSSASYTVPAGKYFVGDVRRSGTSTAAITVQVASNTEFVLAGEPSTDWTGHAVVLLAGQVVSTPTSSPAAVVLQGLLYDV